MSLKMPVVLLCQEDSDPDSDPWLFQGKCCVQNLSEQCCVVLGEINIQETGSHCKFDYLFFNFLNYCQTKLWVTEKQPVVEK